MGRRLRILHVIGSLQIGGAESQLVEIVRGLAGSFEFHVGLLSEGGPLEQPVRAAGGRIHPLLPGGAARHAAPRGWLALRAGSRLRSLLRDLAPDVLHAWLFETSILAAAARWPRRAPPLIVSRRNLLEWFARRNAYGPLARWTNGQADLLLANSEAVREDVARKEGVEPGRVEVIYNGVDTEAFRPGPADEGLRRELGLPAGMPVVGMVANLHSYKGHLEVVRAVAALREDGMRCALLFVGREEDGAGEVRRAVTASGLSPVVFAGPRPDVAELLRLMDVFVSASHEEGFSNSILEAMAEGLPVVATRVGGSVEQIEEGETGLLVPPRDVPAMAAAVGRLLRDGELRGRLGRAARDSVVRRFGLPRLLAEMAALYRARAPGPGRAATAD